MNKRKNTVNGYEPTVVKNEIHDIMKMKTEVKTINMVAVVLLIIICIASVVGNVVLTKISKEQMDLSKKRMICIRLERDLISEHIKAEQLEDSHQALASSLYNSLWAYYNKSKNKVFRTLFEERIPSLTEFNESMDEGFIVIYALMENFPDIRTDPLISHALGQLDLNRTKLNDSIKKYNTILHNYQVSVMNYNTTIEESSFLKMNYDMIDDAKFKPIELDDE